MEHSTLYDVGTSIMARTPSISDEDGWNEYRLLIQHIIKEIRDDQQELRSEIEELRDSQPLGELSKEELIAIRKLVKDFDRYRLAWGILGRLSAYVAGFVVAVYGIRELFPKIWQAIKVVFQ